MRRAEQPSAARDCAGCRAGDPGGPPRLGWAPGEPGTGPDLRDLGIGLSIHSNSHLGISLAAMTHLAAATPNHAYDCDTHYPWREEEVIEVGKLRVREGPLANPDLASTTTGPRCDAFTRPGGSTAMRSVTMQASCAGICRIGVSRGQNTDLCRQVVDIRERTGR